MNGGTMYVCTVCIRMYVLIYVFMYVFMNVLMYCLYVMYGDLWIREPYAVVRHNSSFVETGGLDFPLK